MTILVIGGSGFFGHALIERLLSQGEDVLATSRTADRRFSRRGLSWRDFELSSFTDYKNLLNGISVVYHLGWSSVPSTSELAPAGDVMENVVGSVRLIDSICRHDTRVRLVFASSGGTVYGRIRSCPVNEDHPLKPIGAYGLSKAAVERYIDSYAQTSGLDAITLRFGNAFGPRQKLGRTFGAVTTFCANALAGRILVIFGDGSNVRDYLYIDDAIDALIVAAKASPLHRHFNIGSGIGHSLNQIVDAIAEITGCHPRVERREARIFDVPISVLDISRARIELGWQSKVPFSVGLTRTLEGLRRSNDP